jgi:diphthamide biosynthesis enzyme Dph1/Dph2-like protein
MKIMFVEARSKEDITNVIKKAVKKVGGKVGLVSSVQFLNQLPKAQKIIKNSVIVGQVLGCNMSNPIIHNKNIDMFLFIGSAYFYPIYLAYKTKKKVLIANPMTENISWVNEEEFKQYEKKLRGKQAKFLMSNKIGVIVSTKPGQEKLQTALKMKYPVFVCNELDENELENFQMDYWINTACNRIEGKNIINLEDLPK